MRWSEAIAQFDVDTFSSWEWAEHSDIFDAWSEQSNCVFLHLLYIFQLSLVLTQLMEAFIVLMVILFMNKMKLTILLALKYLAF